MLGETYLSDIGEEQCSSSTTDHQRSGSDFATDARVDHSSSFGLSSVLESQDPSHVHEIFLGVEFARGHALTA